MDYSGRLEEGGRREARRRSRRPRRAARTRYHADIALAGSAAQPWRGTPRQCKERSSSSRLGGAERRSLSVPRRRYENIPLSPEHGECPADTCSLPLLTCVLRGPAFITQLPSL
ncbi:hypothetical protein SKAU_G00319440 [Synaphobranchus kaupii]|uniref:Uncharacterized protein n=1 Tax=Synaphobranchus kaupii TaxID=118154 RepID=A0A9Q1IJM1_SYNKA|nr:hypothetical protein SKAU_G00319440 [Synaphobranchus kaupii]